MLSLWFVRYGGKRMTLKVMVGAAACLIAAMCGAGPAHARAITVGQPAPDFKMRLADGSKVTLADLKGQVVILNLWATWCGPCKTEMPGLDLIQLNGGKLGLRVFGVLVMDATPIYNLRKLGKVLHYPLVSYLSGGYEPIGNAVPTNYIIDRNGIVRYAKATALEPRDFAEILGPLLQEKVDPAPPGPVKISQSQ